MLEAKKTQLSDGTPAVEGEISYFNGVYAVNAYAGFVGAKKGKTDIGVILFSGTNKMSEEYKNYMSSLIIE